MDWQLVFTVKSTDILYSVDNLKYYSIRIFFLLGSCDQLKKTIGLNVMSVSIIHVFILFDIAFANKTV